MEKQQQPEALILANDRPSEIGDDLYQWAFDAEDMIRRLHARNQELEAMLDAVGAGGVSAQRVTQAKDHIEQPIEMVAAPAELNLDDYYCKGCGRIGEIEELSAQDKAKLRKLDGKPKTAPVVLPEPDEYQYRMKGNWDDKLPWTAWEACSKESAAIFRKLKEVHNWIYEVRERYTEQQVRDLLATGGQPQADARDAERYLDYPIHNQARVCNNLDEYEGDEDCADCGYWTEFTDSNSQRWVQIGVFKTPRDAIDAAIAAAKGAQK